MVQVSMKAAVSGTVWKLLKKPGDQVSAGEAILIMESMKMEIPLEAPNDATVLEIQVADGERVKEGEVVVVLKTG